MKLNLEEQEETIEPVEKTDLIYGIDDRPPFKEALFAALQHLLAIFVAIITPPLIIAGALKLDLETTGFLVSMALFASGVSTFIQCRRIGPVGAKLLCIQGTSFIQLTGVASRYVGYYIAGMLVLLGLFPVVGVVFSLMPDPVLGGATLLMFGTVAAAGIRIIASQEINRKATLVLAVSLSLGLGVELMPDILNTAPEAVKGIFSSGITTGGLAAIIANVLIRVKEDKTE